MRGLIISILSPFFIVGCGGGVDVVKGNIQGAKFEEVLDVTFDQDTITDLNGNQFTIGMTVLYGGLNGFCEDLNDAILGDVGALTRINTLDQLVVINKVGAGQNPDVIDAVPNNNTLIVSAIFDPAQADGNNIFFDEITANDGAVTMSFSTGEGQLNKVLFAEDKISVDVFPLNVQCQGMVEFFFEGQ